jgi:hypothetical protein
MPSAHYLAYRAAVVMPDAHRFTPNVLIGEV